MSGGEEGGIMLKTAVEEVQWVCKPGRCRVFEERRASPDG